MMLRLGSGPQRPIPDSRSAQRWKLEIGSRTLKSIVVVGMLAGLAVANVSCGRGSESPADDTSSDGIAVITKAGAVERLLERTAPHVPDTAAAPSFVVDPGWPKPLPNNWRLGQIGGLFVDRHDTIWVYHRPRSLSTTEAGALDEPALDLVQGSHVLGPGGVVLRIGQVLVGARVAVELLVDVADAVLPQRGLPGRGRQLVGEDAEKKWPCDDRQCGGAAEETYLSLSWGITASF